jgi:NTP pyrophosphatase (non-canonical NTP hydrolase)
MSYLTLNIAVAETWHWLTACFDRPICFSKEERGLRFLEEALELAQATGVSAEKAQRLLQVVYAKEPGAVPAEVGDALNTLLCLAARYKIDLTGQHAKTTKRNWVIKEQIAEKWRNKIVADDLQELQFLQQGPAQDKILQNSEQQE